MVAVTDRDVIVVKGTVLKEMFSLKLNIDFSHYIINNAYLQQTPVTVVDT